MVEYHARVGRTAAFFLGTLAVAFCALPAEAAPKQSVPDWVREAAAKTLPTYAPETNAVVLLDDTIYSVAPNGQATEHHRRVVKILRPAGRDEGIVTVPFDKDSKVLSLHVWSIGPDGHEYAVDDKEIIEFGYPNEGPLYEDLKV